jgi:hypothetical protein
MHTGKATRVPCFDLVPVPPHVHKHYLLAVIKKCHYWPKYINSSNIDAHFDFKEIGQTDSLPGTLEQGTEFKVFA